MSGADDLDQLLGDDFTVELHAVEPRIDPPPDTPHIADIVLRARRRLTPQPGGVLVPPRQGLVAGRCRQIGRCGAHRCIQRPGTT